MANAQKTRAHPHGISGSVGYVRCMCVVQMFMVQIQGRLNDELKIWIFLFKSSFTFLVKKLLVKKTK